MVTTLSRQRSSSSGSLAAVGVFDSPFAQDSLAEQHNSHEQVLLQQLKQQEAEQNSLKNNNLA